MHCIHGPFTVNAILIAKFAMQAVTVARYSAINNCLWCGALAAPAASPYFAL